MNISQGSLVIVGLNTTEPKVFWNGQEVPGVAGMVVYALLNGWKPSTESMIFVKNAEAVIAQAGTLVAALIAGALGVGYLIK